MRVPASCWCLGFRIFVCFGSFDRAVYIQVVAFAKTSPANEPSRQDGIQNSGFCAGQLTFSALFSPFVLTAELAIFAVDCEG